MSSLEDLRDVRIQKLNKLQSLGKAVFPIESGTTKTVQKVLESWQGEDAPQGVETLSGRVMAIRGQGALIFLDLFDGTGNLQGLLRKGDCDDAERELFAETVDVGDFVSITGTFFTSQRGEKTILVSAWKMLSKSLRPMPEKWAGLQDVEEKMRKRYLDILTDKDVRRKFEIRVATVSAIRAVLQDAGYLEVETPMFQPLYGGASAMPFTTHYNALETDFYLRISPELYLKRLLVAGFPKVFELNRNFRNEGIDVTHSPEFTMLEFYSAYETAKSQMAFVESMLRSVVQKVFKSGVITHEGVEINFDNKFGVVSYFDLFSTYADLKNIGTLSIEELTEEAKKRGVKVEESDATPKIMDNIYKKHCRPKLVQPTFIIDYPAEYLPLAKRSEENPDFVDAFQLVIAGTELVKAFSELNDPLDQRKRFEDQEKSKKLGDKEAQSLDEDYIEAMEHGMPPAGGVGIGIDRLLMLLTDSHNIRDIILFPTLKPKN